MNQISSKKGLAEKWAAGCCGGCAGAAIIGGLMPNTGTEASIGTVIGGAVVLGIMGGGTGYLIGMLIDKWNPVYSGGPMALLHKMDFKLGPDTKGGFHFGLSYNF